jgi:CubicO group peptidase (beta-lactamase class C family)
VRKFIPDWADHLDRITIRHLLTHTSGLRDGFVLRELEPPRHDEGVNLNDSVVKTLARQRGLNFPPGSEFGHCQDVCGLL